MNFSIFFIILCTVQIILCSHWNGTINHTCDLCTISWFRRKRAQAEYTRWRASQETTQEFIVKVLDEDVTTLRSQTVIAVNIQPVLKNEKKIVIGGALVPLVSNVSTISGPIEYTRFMPPTTLLQTHGKTNAKSIPDESVIMTPRGLIKSNFEISPGKHAPVKHIHRDESPPSGPQFLNRNKSPFARQYAPVARVSFNRASNVTPVTPRSIERFIYKTPSGPTRTPSIPDVIKPSRTTIKISGPKKSLFNKNDVTDDQMLVSRTSSSAVHVPQRTLSTKCTQEIDESFESATKDRVINWRINKLDSYDGNDEDKESDKKEEKDGYKLPAIDDDQYELPLADLELSKSLKENVGDIEEADNSTYLSTYNEEEEDLQNITLEHIPTHKAIITATDVTKAISQKRKLFCSMIKLRQLNFNAPRTLPEITAQLKHWAETSPVAKWVDITNGNYTTMENPIYMMIVDDPSSGQIISAKKTVLIIAGLGIIHLHLNEGLMTSTHARFINPFRIQGRDHHAVTAAMYVLYQLIERSETHADLLTKYRFWIIPIFNPDGYDYSMTFPHKREWAKNLRQKWDSCKGRESCQTCDSFGLRCTIQSCYGVNLDRNFEYQWIPTEELRAEHPCGALHAGDRQLSEPETRALTKHLNEHRSPLSTFIAFKEGDVLGILYPYSHTRKRRAFDNIYRQRASRAASAAYSIGGRPYVAGQTSEFLPLYAGGIEDWVDGHLGIDNTYTVMMFRPSDSYDSKLVTERVVHEAYAAMDTLLLQSAEKLGSPPVTLTKAAAPLPHTCSPTLVTVTPILFLCYYYCS